MGRYNNYKKLMRPKHFDQKFARDKPKIIESEIAGYLCVNGRRKHKFKLEPAGEHYQGVCQDCSFAPIEMIIANRSSSGHKNIRGSQTDKPLKNNQISVDFKNEKVEE